MYINKACARACVSLASQTPEKTVFMYNVERERHTHAHIFTHSPHPTQHFAHLQQVCNPHAYTYTKIHNDVHIYICAYVCVCCFLFDTENMACTGMTQKSFSHAPFAFKDSVIE